MPSLISDIWLHKLRVTLEHPGFVCKKDNVWEGKGSSFYYNTPSLVFHTVRCLSYYGWGLYVKIPGPSVLHEASHTSDRAGWDIVCYDRFLGRVINCWAINSYCLPDYSRSSRMHWRGAKIRSKPPRFAVLWLGGNVYCCFLCSRDRGRGLEPSRAWLLPAGLKRRIIPPFTMV